MSEEIPMAEKLKMLREAMPKGTALGDSGFSGTPAYSDPVVFPSCSVSHDIHEGNRVEPAPFPDDPEVGSSAGADTCNSFNLYTETVGSTVKLMVGGGQIGTQYFAGKELGTLSSKHGHIAYLEVDLNGTTGTYTVDVKTAATFPTDGSPTKAYFSIGTISATGAITQQMCGNFMVNVCRNWFTATAPFYNISISGISRNYFNL
jgi:hypothetical protein